MDIVIILTWEEDEGIRNLRIITQNGEPKFFDSVMSAEEWSDSNDPEFGEYYRVVNLAD